MIGPSAFTKQIGKDRTNFFFKIELLIDQTLPSYKGLFFVIFWKYNPILKVSMDLWLKNGDHLGIFKEV